MNNYMRANERNRRSARGGAGCVLLFLVATLSPHTALATESTAVAGNFNAYTPNKSLRANLTASGFVALRAQEPFVWNGQRVNLWAPVRGFNFSGDSLFINPASGQSDIGLIQADGQQLIGAQITTDGFRPYVGLQTDPDFPAVGPALRVLLDPTHRMTADSWRTQLETYPLLPYRTYRWLLTFRLDKSWDVNLPGEAGLLWQLKGRPKPGQAGNPVLALNLSGSSLYWHIAYPISAMTATPGSSLAWSGKEYVPVSGLARKEIVAGRYYNIEFEFFADERPALYGGEGYFRAWFEGQPWIDYKGPTLHPDQAGPHYTSFGWYQWQGHPSQSRIVWWLRNEAYTKH